MNLSRFRPRIAPFLAAWYLALILLAESGEVFDRIPDLVGSLLFATLTAVACWCIACLISAHPGRQVSMAVLLVLWAGLYGNARILGSPILGDLASNPQSILMFWSLLFLALITLVSRLPQAGDGVVGGLTAALLLLLVMAIIPIGLSWRQARQSAGPSTSTLPIPRTPDRPDIYILFLDKFSSPAILQEHFGLDVTPFVDSLRAMGFAIPGHPRSNYIHTQMVMSTMLNWRMVRDEMANAPEGAWVRTEHLIEDAKAWDFLKGRGYRFAFFPTGFPGTARNHHADIVLTAPEPRVVRFGQTWILNTPIDLVLSKPCRGSVCGVGSDFPYPIERAEAMRWKLETLGTLPDSAGPIVAFLHFLGSHEPYIFERDCTARIPWWPSSDIGVDSARARTAYADQINCVTQLVLQTVRTLIQRSAVPPVIILQADHGHGSIAIDPVRGITLGRNRVTGRQINERLDVFAAYLFPTAKEVVYDSISPVNILPVVFDALFQANIPLLPDRAFWSTFQRPTDVSEVFR